MPDEKPLTQKQLRAMHLGQSEELPPSLQNIDLSECLVNKAESDSVVYAEMFKDAERDIWCAQIVPKKFRGLGCIDLRHFVSDNVQL